MSNYGDYTPIIKRIIELVDEETDRCGHSYEKMCEYTSISPSTWGKIKGGLTQNPKVDTLMSLARYTNTSVAYLVGESKYKKVDNDIILKELTDLGFSESMVANLRRAKESSGKAWAIYKVGLICLFERFFKEENLPLLFAIGKYFCTLNETGKDLVSSEELQRLDYAINSTEISKDAIKLQIETLLKGRKHYESEDLKAHWLQQVTFELQRISVEMNKAIEEKADEISKVNTQKGMIKYMEEKFNQTISEEQDIIFYPEKELK